MAKAFSYHRIISIFFLIRRLIHFKQINRQQTGNSNTRDKYQLVEMDRRAHEKQRHFLAIEGHLRCTK